MRPIFCGNFEYDARQSDLERLFGKYGKVDRVDMKSGFAFVYMDDERDAEDAIRALDRYEFGRQGRRLRVEWTKQERGGRRSAGSRRSSANMKPTKTLFVINFDPVHTRTRDLERHFDPFGKILNIRIRRNFAFIQFESQDEATKALDATNMSKLMDRVISVEYAVRDDDEKRNGYSPERRGHGRSPERSRDRRRSPSPYQRERGSPDYGRNASPVRRSRDRVRSPSPYRRERGSPDYGRGLNHERRSRDRGLSPERRSRDHVLSPERRSRDHGLGSERKSRDRGQIHEIRSRDRSLSPERRSHDRGLIPEIRSRERSLSPERRSLDRDRSPERRSLDRGPSPERRSRDIVQSPPSPYEREQGSPEYGNGSSPNTKPDNGGSPGYGRAESPPYEKYHSPPEEP
ncbi:Serine/arginine-rich splicing factor RS40 [Thalictrum thalictroides]|uniref:Serine/arginine-rich splicing factor RS40 n=1 Tax=Thalictrum thalictroides TaxID=46969 RepID=A0A7J6V2H0_THATH|nr:Serine/arginine-rich splicing factor RS40 [Thalictrum thalictroides]